MLRTVHRYLSGAATHGREKGADLRLGKGSKPQKKPEHPALAGRSGWQSQIHDSSEMQQQTQTVTTVVASRNRS